ncbi:MAG TPA: sulfotransferase [Rhizomicrobium sp.]|jgi:Tfp pilus assembly protein PilF|nr:sulfotransferase [Rhizomicrobium sp.]
MSSQHAATPQSTADAVRMVAEAIAACEYRHASEIADAALAQGFVDTSLYNARALWLERQGQNEDALTEFQRARALAPRSFAILNAIGLCLMRLQRLDEATAAFDEAIRINPAYSPSHQRRGVVLGMCGRAREAEDAYRRAVSLDPRNAEALANLATVSARNGNHDSAQRNAERALAIDPQNATAHAALALVEMSRRQFVAAESRLRPLVSDPKLMGHGRAVVLNLLGDALDEQGRCAEAFAAFDLAHQELRGIHSPRFEGKPTMSGMLERLSGWFGETPAEAWRPSDNGNAVQPARLHVFLLGFYRSGTTLLEQVLESHPEVATLEEQDFLAEAAERFLTSAEGFDRLLQLEAAELEQARANYWEQVGGLGIRSDGKVFIDKHPLNTAKLPLIRKFFPAAKVLFAIRDPRDVVLSCVRRHFEINAVMHEFLTLEGTAKLYDRVMGFADICRQKLPLDLFEHRYEDLVSDFDGQVRAVCDFLGLEFSESMANFSETTRGSDIRSPSVQQVRRGLYKESVGQWRRYHDQLSPVLPVLAPWVHRFGYEDG